MELERDVPLAPMTTLELGGAAEWFLEARSEAELVEGIRWARAEGHPVTFLGGGSNAIVPDAGVRGLVVRIASRGVSREGETWAVAAGEPWDPLVAQVVAEGFSGLECLAGIPGAVGATPIQNVGAYGQEVSDTIASVRCVELASLEVVSRTPDECGFGYRDSDFKRRPGRYVVTEVRFGLRGGGAPTIRYGELSRTVGEGASLAEVREAVVALRRRKSMVLDPEDPNRRSAGSFFTNPIVTREVAAEVVRRAVGDVVESATQVPRWPVGERVKLAAGWLIEKGGFAKGTRRGNVGLSTKHALALVHHGGGTTAALLAFAEEIAGGVEARWGVRLEREPRLLGE